MEATTTLGLELSSLPAVFALTNEGCGTEEAREEGDAESSPSGLAAEWSSAGVAGRTGF